VNVKQDRLQSELAVDELLRENAHCRPAVDQQVDDGRRPDEKPVQAQIGHVLAGGEKVDLTIQMRAQMVRVAEQLPVGPTCPNSTTLFRFYSAE